MKRVLLFLSILLFSSLSTWAQYPLKWSIGGAMGFGATTGYGEPDFTMGLTVGFNAAIKGTKWRWGIDAGLMNQGLMDYFFEGDEPDMFLRPNYEYISGVIDYSLYSNDKFALFVRGGLAPACRTDLYIWHTEEKYTCLGIIGIGMDHYISHFTINGYIDPGGYFVLMLSYGWWFGKQMTPWW